jgi:hypothetical protein
VVLPGATALGTALVKLTCAGRFSARLKTSAADKAMEQRISEKPGGRDKWRGKGADVGIGNLWINFSAHWRM